MNRTGEFNLIHRVSLRSAKMKLAIIMSLKEQTDALLLASGVASKYQLQTVSLSLLAMLSS